MPGCGRASPSKLVSDARHDSQQRGFAGTVQAEHADLGARKERQADVAQDRALGRHDLRDPCSSCRCIAPCAVGSSAATGGRALSMNAPLRVLLPCAIFAAGLRCRRLKLEVQRLNAQDSEVAVVLGERLARYGFGDGHPFGAGPARRLPARIRAARARRAGAGARAARCRAEPSCSCFTPPSTCASSWSARRPAAACWMRGDTPAFRGVFEAAACVVGCQPGGRRVDHARALRRRAFVPIGGLHHAARDRAAGFCVFNDCGVVIETPAARARPGAHRPTSTSTRIMAMASSTDSRTIRASSLPTCTRADARSIRAPAMRARPAGAPRPAPSSTCRCRPAPAMRSSRRYGRRCWPTWSVSSRSS